MRPSEGQVVRKGTREGETQLREALSSTRNWTNPIHLSRCPSGPFLPHWKWSVASQPPSEFANRFRRAPAYGHIRRIACAYDSLLDDSASSIRPIRESATKANPIRLLPLSIGKGESDSRNARPQTQKRIWRTYQAASCVSASANVTVHMCYNRLWHPI